MAVLHNTSRHSRERDYIELWGKKTFKWTGTSLCHADSILACYATSLIFIENILIFSHPLFFNSLLFCKRFDCVFSKLFFFPDRDPVRQVFGKKKTFSGACVQLCHADLILACHAKVLISFDSIRSMIRDPIRHPIGDPVPDPICDPTRSDPDFVDAELP